MSFFSTPNTFIPFPFSSQENFISLFFWPWTKHMTDYD
jgi:hypothetical protein